MAKLKKTDKELVQLVGARQSVSNGLWDSRLSTERSDVQKYFDGLAPHRTSAGSISYVSHDVYEGVEGMKAQLLETFSGTLTPIRLTGEGPEDEQHAIDATEFVSHAIFRDNCGYEVMRDVIDDALKCRVGIVKVWWEKNEEETEQEISDVSYQDFQSMLAQAPDMELDELDLDPETQTVRSAKLVTKKDISQVRIETVPPEEFGITRKAKSKDDADIVFHRRPVSVDTLIQMGVDKTLAKSLKGDSRFWLESSPEFLERHQESDDATIGERDDEGNQKDSTTREVDVTEAYCRLDLDGRPALWRLLVAEHKLLMKEKVKRLPFLIFTPLPRPHAFWGSNYAKKLIPTQIAKTMLVRSVVDHALITNNPRTGVVKGGLMNPKELLENRLGGIVNITRPDALVPIQQTGLNPFVFQTIGLLDDRKEETTGLSRLSQGLNKDAISKQNSADMVQSLVALSQTRQKIVARNFAEGFLKPLFLEVYRLLVENGAAARPVEVAGQWKMVDPSAWPDRLTVLPEVAVGYGEQQQEVSKWLAIDAYLGSNPRFAAHYTPERQHEVIRRSILAGGIKNVDAIFAPMDQARPPPPNPKAEADVAETQARAEQQKANAQATLQKVELEREKMRTDLQLRQLEMQHELKMAELKERLEVMKLQAQTLKLQQQAQQFQMELAAAEQADKTTGVLSPDA